MSSRSAQQPWPYPAFLNCYGHSYMQIAFGTRTQQGRIDGYVRSVMHTGPGPDGWQNHSISGAKLTSDTQSQGGWTRMMYYARGSNLVSPVGGPYVPNGGAFLFVWGINDLGALTNTVQANTAYQHAMRACISRARASVVYRNDYPNSTNLAFGAGFISQSFSWDYSSGNQTYKTITTVNATVTFTLPSDYKGETVAICFLWDPSAGGGSGGIVTFSGTAGVSGTFNMQQLLPNTATSKLPVVFRVKNLTAANAGQTIVSTVTTLGASGDVLFDSCWLESSTPSPVVVCNTARLRDNAAYSIYPAWTSSQVSADSDVQTFNTYLNSVVAEFDGMVQIADIDTALGKNPNAYGTDGLHPNEWGAAGCADAIANAYTACIPQSTYGEASNMQSQSPVSGVISRPHKTQQWYLPDAGGINPLGVNEYTILAQDAFAIPFYVSQGQTRWANWSLTFGSQAASTAPTVNFVVMDDRTYQGYPQNITDASANGAALSIGTSGTFTSTNTPGQNGFLGSVKDVGLYWLVILFVTAGSPNPGTLRTIKGPSMFMPGLSNTGAPISGNPCAWYNSGAGVGPIPQNFQGISLGQPGFSTLVDNPPAIGIKMGQ